MNKSGIIIVASFLAGVGTGYLLAENLLKKKYEAIVQEEIDSIREAFVNRPSRDTVQNESLADEIAKEYDKEENFRSHTSPLARSSLDRNKSELAKKDYQIYKPSETVKIPTPKEPEAEVIDKESPDPEYPYIIDDRAYSEECDHFAKIALVYYPDGVLMTEDEEMVDDVTHTIGDEAFDHLMNGNTDPMWIRNEKVGADYEIVVMTQPYGEMMDPPSIGSMRRRKPYEGSDDTDDKD